MDNQVIAFRNKWQSVAIKATHEQKNQVSKLYLQTVLRLNADQSTQFLAYDEKAKAIAQERHLALGPQDGSEAFWGGIVEIFPETHTPHDIEFLTTGNVSFGPLLFLLILTHLGRRSEVLDLIVANAHSQKLNF